MDTLWNYVSNIMGYIWHMWNEISFDGVSVAAIWALGVFILVVEILLNLGEAD